MTPIEQSEQLSEKLSKVKELSGDYVIDYFTGDCTVIIVNFPSGRCDIREYDQTRNDYVCDQVEWDNFSTYTQQQILMEVCEKFL